MNLDPLAALGFGTFVGFLVQLVAARLRYNGTWGDVPLGRKIATSSTGAIAAFIAGLWILDHPPAGADTPYVYRLWFWQTIAAWLGSLFLDIAGRALLGAIRAKGNTE